MFFSNTPTGALFATTPLGESFLSGDLDKVGFATNPTGADRIEMLFRDLDGTAAGSFRPFARLALTGEFGVDPLGVGFGSFADPVEVEIRWCQQSRFPPACLCYSLRSVACPYLATPGSDLDSCREPFARQLAGAGQTLAGRGSPAAASDGGC
jgi:hypothetical protein